MAPPNASSESRSKTPKSSFPAPEIPRGGGDRILRTREENRKKLAETEKRDAGSE